LFELATAGPATSAELAERGGLQERYVREWLAAMATAGIFEYNPRNRRFWLPAEHATVLTGDSYDNLAPLAYLLSVIIRQGEAVSERFTPGRRRALEGVLARDARGHGYLVAADVPRHPRT
jgi:hypothetical protein